MSRRHTGHMSGERYCGNVKAEEMHDLDFEQPDCHIDEIIHAGFDVPLESVEHGHTEGFDNCRWCLGSTRHRFANSRRNMVWG